MAAMTSSFDSDFCPVSDFFKFGKKKVFFHHDKAPAHTSAVATVNWSNCTMNFCPIDRILQIWPHVTFFLFPNLKKSLAGQKFESNEEVIAATEAYFAYLKKTYFSDGLKNLEHRWVMCIMLKGDYVEK